MLLYLPLLIGDDVVEVPIYLLKVITHTPRWWQAGITGRHHTLVRGISRTVGISHTGMALVDEVLEVLLLKFL